MAKLYIGHSARSKTNNKYLPVFENNLSDDFPAFLKSNTLIRKPVILLTEIK